MRRRFEFEEGTSSKFWEIEISGTTVTTWWGKIGTAGQSKAKDFGSADKAQHECDKLVAEKSGKGYKEVGGAAGASSPAAAAALPAPTSSAGQSVTRQTKKGASAQAKSRTKSDEDDDDDESEDDEESCGTPAGCRRFEFEEDNSSKFWEIKQDGSSLTTCWGKLGTAGQSKTLDFESESETRKQYDKLVLEKTKKGYKEVGGSATSAQASNWPACIGKLKPMKKQLSKKELFENWQASENLSSEFLEELADDDIFWPLRLKALLGSCATSAYLDCPNMPEHHKDAAEDDVEALESIGKYYWVDFDALRTDGPSLAFRLVYNEGDADCNDGFWGAVWDRNNGELVANICSTGDMETTIGTALPKYADIFAEEDLSWLGSLGGEQFPYNTICTNELERVIQLAILWSWESR